MKAKWGLIFGAALSAIALAACGGSGGSNVSTNGNSDLFTSAGFQKALDAVKEKAGDNARVLQVQITGGGAEFTMKNGEQATGFIYTGGDLHDQKVELVGPFSIAGQDFPLSEVDPAAINKIVSAVESQSGNADTKVTVLKLDKQNIDGTVQWSIIAEGGGRTGIPYTAEPDGSNVTSPLSGISGSSGTSTSGGTSTSSTEASGGITTPSGKTPAEIAQCIQQAGTDVSKIQACAK